MTGAQSYFTRLERNRCHLRTSQAHLNEAGPQLHTDNMFMVHLQVRLPDRLKHIDRDPHLFHPVTVFQYILLISKVALLLLKHRSPPAPHDNDWPERYLAADFGRGSRCSCAKLQLSMFSDT